MTIATFFMILIGSCLFAQNVPVFEIQIDSVVKGEVYLHMVRYVPDSVSMNFTRSEIKDEINEINQRLLFQRSLKKSFLAEIDKEDYSKDFKLDMSKQKDDINNFIKRLLLDKQQLVAIRDSTTSYLGK